MGNIIKEREQIKFSPFIKCIIKFNALAGWLANERGNRALCWIIAHARYAIGFGLYLQQQQPNCYTTLWFSGVCVEFFLLNSYRNFD